MRSFLEGRSQRVLVDGSTSDIANTEYGAPQGSVLSPLLFLIYMADLPLWTTASITSYADDTTASMSHKDLKELERSLEKEATAILSFMASNWLVANTKKTNYLLIQKKPTQGRTLRSSQISVGRETIHATSSVNILGIEVTWDLSGREHVRKMKNMILSRLGILGRLNSVVPRALLRTVVHGLVLSGLRMGLAIYGEVQLSQEDTKTELMGDLQITLNRIMRLMIGCRISDRVSLDALVQRTGLPTVNRISAEMMLTELKRALDHDIPGITEKLRPSVATHIKTRSSGQRNVPRPKPKHQTRTSFATKASLLWNRAPTQIKEEKSPRSFKKSVKEYVNTLPL